MALQGLDVSVETAMKHLLFSFYIANRRRVFAIVFIAQTKRVQYQTKTTCATAKRLGISKLRFAGRLGEAHAVHLA